MNFKGNFDVLNYWNCELTEDADGTYTITHTSWQNSIPAGGEYVIGFVGSKTDDEMVISDVEMRVTGCGAGSGETETDPTKPSEPETSPVAPTEPSTEPPTTETPMEPETSTAAPTEPTTPSETEPAETEPTTAAPEINWDDETDTDGDGLPDVYEINMFDTNPEKADTDGDNLPDGYELLNLGTDPAKADSDDNGITDDKEDADNDGLDNMTEYQLGTNPTSADGDYDGLSDKEEIENYGTDPSDFDTDDDGIGDGDELKLGLDPLNPSTNGVPDGQYTIKQTIGVESEVLDDVNSSTENPFELSLEVKAAGLAEKSLTVQGSADNAMFQNESYVGELITIDYKDTMEFESIQINFVMDENVLGNELDLFGDETTELKGIRRFNVFKFVEEMNMLLPIETFHNDETNTVYTVTDSDGMYYLVDMEKWLYGLQQLNAEEEAQVMSLQLDEEQEIPVDVTTVQNQPGEAMTEKMQEEMTAIAEMIESENMPATMSLSDRWFVDPTVSSQPVDIVLVFQLYNLWDYGDSTIILNAMKIWIGVLEEKYENLRVCVLCRLTDDEAIFLGSYENCPKWFEGSYEMQSKLPWAHHFREGEAYLERKYFDLLLDQEVMGYREDAAKFVFDVQIGKNIVDYFYFSDSMKRMKKAGIIFSEFQNMDNAYLEHTDIMSAAIEMTGGKIFSQEMIDYFVEIPRFVESVMSGDIAPQKEFNAIVATGYSKVILQSPLRSTSNMDSDADDIRDWDEVYTELIKWDSNGNIILPSIQDCIENAGEKSYIIDGLARFKADNTPGGMPSEIYEAFMQRLLECTYVLPIHSHPTRKDGDGDGLDDYYDKYNSETMDERYVKLSPLKINTMETLYPELQLHDSNINNNRQNAVYFDINGNVIDMHVRILFEGDYAQNFIENGVELDKTYKDVALDGLQLWSGTYQGAFDATENVHYDFVEGLSFDFNVIVEEWDIQYPGRESYVIFNVDNTDYDDNVLSNLLSACFSYGIPHTATLFWSPENIGGAMAGLGPIIGKITMYKAWKSYEDYTEEGYKHTAAHEFGHVLGLNDAYPGANDDIILLSNKEVVTQMPLYSTGILMDYNGMAYANDIEMILEGFSTAKWQRYVKLEKYDISPVIRLKQNY